MSDATIERLAINARIREIKKQLRESNQRVISIYNAGLTDDEYRLNREIQILKARLRKLQA